MYIFADSGSTKTNWVITHDDGSQRSLFQTIGLNPYFVTRTEVELELRRNYPPDDRPDEVRSVFFYGSGCEAHDNFVHLKAALSSFFPKADIYLFSDMLGTARAIFKNDIGIAAIIGTGTNSCLYDGKHIVQNGISLGYVLGDEGSGAYIGKMFVKQYLEQKFDAALTQLILSETGETRTSILAAVYQQSHPNRFLAKFTHFINKHIDNPQLQALMTDAFDRFFVNFIEIFPNYKHYQIGFCGSIAKYFKPFLMSIVERHGMKMPIFINEPLNELIEYHRLNSFV